MIAVIAALLGGSGLGGSLGRLGGTALLLAEVLLERDVMRELVLALVRGDGVHHAEHGGHGRLVAHRARGIGQEETVGDGVGGGEQRHERKHDGGDPQQDLEHAGKRKDAHDGDDAGGQHTDRHELGDERAIGGECRLGQQLGARGVVMGHHDDGAVARGGQGARRLVIGDDVLAHARLTDLGEYGVPGSLEAVQHGGDDGEQRAQHPDGAADAHEQGSDKCHDPHDGITHPARCGSVELLHLGIESMVTEDLGDILGSQTLLFAARRRDARALQQVVDIFLGVRHVRSTSIIRQIGPILAR